MLADIVMVVVITNAGGLPVPSALQEHNSQDKMVLLAQRMEVVYQRFWRMELIVPVEQMGLLL